MAATKVMKFWAVCLAVLGKLLASLGVSAAASAARRDAALYERTLGKGNAGAETPGGDASEAERAAVPEHHPERRTRAVPAPRTVPLYGQATPARRGSPVRSCRRRSSSASGPKRMAPRRGCAAVLPPVPSR